MSVLKFAPQAWAKKFQDPYYATIVFSQNGIVNRDYMGEIGMGLTVHINMVGPVQVSDYVPNTDLNPATQFSGSNFTLVINRAKYFNGGIDDVDRAIVANMQLMNQVMTAIAEAFAYEKDIYIASLYVNASTANAIGTQVSPIAMTLPGQAYELIVDANQKLSDALVPTQGRWMVIPPIFKGYLEKDNRFVLSPNPVVGSVILNGMIKTVNGLTLVESVHVIRTIAGGPGHDIWHIMAGVAGAITVAEAFDEVVAYRPERQFKDAIKVLQLYGAKMSRTNSISTIYATIA